MTKGGLRLFCAFIMTDINIEPIDFSVIDPDPSPFVQFDNWYAEALKTGILRPNAMALATSTLKGSPSVRMVLLESFDKEGFIFFTNYESQKGKNLQENNRAEILFYWNKLERQVRIAGTVVKIPNKESEIYFRTRSYESQLSSFISAQSRPLASRKELETQFEDAKTKYPVSPFPASWGGYRLTPFSFEFLQINAHRLHDRVHYALKGSHWVIGRLYP